MTYLSYCAGLIEGDPCPRAGECLRHQQGEGLPITPRMYGNQCLDRVTALGLAMVEGNGEGKQKPHPKRDRA